MRYIFSSIKSLLYSLLLLGLLLASLFIFLLTTTPGLYIATKLAKIAFPGKLYFENIQGRLIDSFSFSHLHYKDDKLELDFTNISLKWLWKSLLDRHLIIENLHADTLDLITTNKAETVKKPSFNLPKLPIDLSINKASINQIQFKKGESTYQINNLILQANLTKQLWQIPKFNFNFNNVNFAMQGQVQPILPYALSANLQFKPISPQGQFLSGNLKIGGDLSLYHWHGELNNPAGLVINGTFRNGYELHTLASWHQLIWPLDKQITIESPEGSLRVDGKIPDLTINLSATTKTPLRGEIQLNTQTTLQSITTKGFIKLPQGDLNLDLAYNAAANPKIQGKILAKSFDLQGTEFPIQQLKFNTGFTGNSFENLLVTTNLSARYLDKTLLGDLRYQNHQVNGQVNLGANQLQLSGSPPYQWQLKATIPEPKLLHPNLEGLDTIINAKASLSSATKGELNLTIHPGSYHPPADNLVSALQFKGGQLSADLNPKNLSIKGNLTIDQFKSLVLALDLPLFQLDKGWSDSQKVQGNLSLNVNSLAFLENLDKDITKIQGQLHAVLKTSGTLGKPVMEGTISLDKAGLVMPKLGLDLNPIQINIQSHTKRWDSQGSLSSQGKVITLRGQGEISPKLNGSVNIDGDNVPLIKTDEYIINLSPKLVIAFTPTSLDLTGTVIVPTAEIKSQSFNKTISLSEDAVFAGAEPAAPLNPLHINTDIRLEMGDKVALDVKNLRGFLTGAIRLRQLPQGPLNASGELDIREGKYKAYGQDLTIDQGQLIFTGGLIENPGIHIRAVRSFNNTTASFSGSNLLFDFNTANLQTMNFGNNITVGVDVTGRIKSPKIELFSVPSTLPQADILSMLLLGKPAKQADQAGGQLLLSAISSMNLGSSPSGVQLLDQLKQTLGVDVNIKSDTKINQLTKQTTESNSVVVTKSVSKRLSVSYNFGLAQADVNVLTITYLLNKFFSIQVNASMTASGVDLLYTHQQEKK